MKLSRTKAALYGNLQTVKMRRRHGLFTVEGAKAVTDMASHFQMTALIVESGCELSDTLISKCVGTANCEIYEVSSREMKELSSFSTPSPVMGVFRIPEETETVIDKYKLYLLLDGVRDPGNLGTIIRTCHWFGIFDIFASHDTVDCYNPKVVQATMGSLGAVRVNYCNPEKLVAENPGMPVYGTLLEGENIFTAELTSNGFVVMGNEGTGISESMRKLLTVGLNIPPATSNHGESLNVAVATAIVLAQFSK